MPSLVDYEARESVALISLTDPPVNGYSYEMMKEFDDAILKARFDPNIQALVIRGGGERFFCAGANIAMLQRSNPEYKYYFCLHANETLLRLEHTPKLVIAAINGHCVGGGLEIAMACDLRIARKEAGKIGLPEINLGVLPGTGGTQRLTRLLGKSRAMQLMLEGSTMTFERGQELGLIHETLAGETADAFVDQVVEYARKFTTPGKASMAVGRIKRAVQAAGEMSLEQGLAYERELQAELFGSADAKEGLLAYTEKRPPSFSGK
jgi:enoyl-CoA hydratase